jgi:enoyl-CoA hydratase
MQETKSSQVLFKEIAAIDGKLGIITLNRPEALNAINLEMTMALNAQLKLWADDLQIHAVIIQSSSERAFSAGGDLKHLYIAGKEHHEKGIPVFRDEYELNLLIHDYPKPYIAFLDGISMGGGLGLSIHGSHIIAAENLRLAMPETAIGLYPDVGATYFLSHCPDYLGMYLGVTGNSIGIADAIYCGLVQTFVPHTKFSEVIDSLTKIDLSADPFSAVSTAIAKFKAEPVPAESSLQQNLSTIKSCFNQASVEDIISALKKNNTPWALDKVATIQSRSPTSLKVAFKSIALGAKLDIAACMEMEFNLTTQIIQHHDIYEGIRAILIDKTHDPKWLPATLAEVPDSVIDAMFKLRCKL